MAGNDAEKPSKNPSDGWKERIYIPTIIAGIIGGGAGLVLKRRKSSGVANLPATYATNLAIVTGCYCGNCALGCVMIAWFLAYTGAREFARETRGSTPDDLINSVLGGIASGALLGRLQGGQIGAIRYSIIFALAGTALDFATLRLKPFLQSYGNINEWNLPEWSPIRVLDEEAVAAKRAREQQLYEQRILGKLNKEES